MLFCTILTGLDVITSTLILKNLSGQKNKVLDILAIMYQNATTHQHMLGIRTNIRHGIPHVVIKAM
jgi:hypothetical protein